MKKEYFTDNLSVETLAEFTDKMLSYEKRQHNERGILMKSNIIKIVSAAAVVVLVIGIINILPAFLSNDENINGETVSRPGVYKNPVNANDTEENIELFLPVVIEKSFFEDKILAVMPEGKPRSRMTAYYTLGYANNYSWESISNGIITTYSLSSNSQSQFYLLDSKIAARERNELLGYLREYTDLTGNDIIQMYKDSGATATEAPDPYAHVRFGDTRNTLLLDIEWYTYDTYTAEVVEPYKKWQSEYMESEDYLKMSDEEQEKFVNGCNEGVKYYEEQANKIKDENLYLAKTVNGKSDIGWLTYVKNSISGDPHITDVDSNGYYTFEIFPINATYVPYQDENGEFKLKTFTAGMSSNGCPIMINSQEEYEKLLNEKVIPFCDDLLARGLINQYGYDQFTIPNLLDYYVDLYF